MNLLATFVFFNILNVIIQTVKSIATIKCNKWVASLVNAVAYGLYTYIVVLTVCNLPLWVKMLVVALANLVGVFVVKLIEEKSRKDKLWKIEMAIPKEELELVKGMLNRKNIPFNYVEVGSWVMFNCYCNEQKDTAVCKSVTKNLRGKISAYESKGL
jgi:uncharacterized protein YebE (UPF0316 family)